MASPLLGLWFALNALDAGAQAVQAIQQPVQPAQIQPAQAFQTGGIRITWSPPAPVNGGQQTQPKAAPAVAMPTKGAQVAALPQDAAIPVVTFGGDDRELSFKERAAASAGAPPSAWQEPKGEDPISFTRDR